MVWDDAPWTAGKLRIAKAALEQIEREAVAGYVAEQEVCGLLGGPLADPLLCDRAVPIENLARTLHERDPIGYPQPARRFFAFHERTLEAALREGRSLDAPMKVLYHSHLDVGAYLSGMDQALLSRGAMPLVEGGPAQLGSGPPWPLAFMVSSVRMVPGVEGPSVDDHRLYVWERGAFLPSTFDVV